MSVIFLKLLNLSISASWLVLVVLVLRLVLKRAPKWVDVLLWGMVALRLMLPFSIESALSLIPERGDPQPRGRAVRSRADHHERRGRSSTTR